MAFRARRNAGVQVLGKYYNVGKLLGSGGFGKCYEVTDARTGYMYACKQIRNVADPYATKRLKEEIQILSQLNHPHVVGYYSYFMDNNNVCILLELCKQQSMDALRVRRKTLTEPEIRYYLCQIINGVSYLHSNFVVHRDLKLPNIFLQNMQVKIGDFGISAIQRSDDQMQWTQIGTPTFLAPEVINGTGHSYEVDVWGIGCIVYTLLMGIGPFHADSRAQANYNIRSLSYVPPKGSRGVNKFIRDVLQLDPQSRPLVNELLSSEFLVNGYTPKELPVSCLTVCPRYSDADKGPSQPLAGSEYAECKAGLRTLLLKVMKLIKSKPSTRRQCKFGDEYTYPSADPVVWATEVCDLTNTHGFVYRFSDKSLGILFNDDTKLTLTADESYVHYITRSGREYYYTLKQYPSSLANKITWLNELRKRISRGRVFAPQGNPCESSTLSRLPHVYRFYRTSRGFVIFFSNGTVQVNCDNCWFLLCPYMCAATLVSSKTTLSTYLFSELEKYGCSSTLYFYIKLVYKQLYTAYLKS